MFPLFCVQNYGVPAVAEALWTCVGLWGLAATTNFVMSFDSIFFFFFNLPEMNGVLVVFLVEGKARKVEGERKTDY